MVDWLQITSGRGPAECCRVVARVVERIRAEADKRHIEVRILEAAPGMKPNIFKSVLLALEGENRSEFAKGWEGTIQWIGESMFRPHHKRKNWFVGVKRLAPPPANQWSDNELRIEKMRSSGPGGQHANKTESAVRVTHVSTGLSAFAQEERSQHLNKKLAMTRLFALLQEKGESERRRHRQERWSQHNRLERGNPVRVYKGGKFKPFKG